MLFQPTLTGCTLTVPEPELILEAALPEEPIKLPSSEDIPPISPRTAAAMAKADKNRLWSCILAVILVSRYNSDSNERRSELERLALNQENKKIEKKERKKKQ